MLGCNAGIIGITGWLSKSADKLTEQEKEKKNISFTYMVSIETCLMT